MTPITRGACAAATVILVATLAGCGNSSTSPGTAATTTAAPSTTAGQSGSQNGPPGGFDPAVIQQAQDCLKAAGISVPSGQPTGVPSDGFTPGANPPSVGTGGPSGPPGGGLFNDPKARAALKACGITIPTNPANAPAQP